MHKIADRPLCLPQVAGPIGQRLAAMAAEQSDIVLQRFQAETRSRAARAGQSPLHSHEGGR